LGKTQAKRTYCDLVAGEPDRDNNLEGVYMKVLFTFLLWAILLVLCWPLALLFIVLWPFLLLLSIPFRIVRALMEAILALVKAILFLPARILSLGADK
jgi:hypothetical protein